MIRALVSRLRTWLYGRRAKRGALTPVEYEAVSIIAYEGRDAYARALQQAAYCRERGSDGGAAFWTAVAEEVASRTGGRIRERSTGNRS